MTTEDMPDSIPVEDLVSELVAIDDDITQLQDRRKNIITQLQGLGPGKYEADDLTLTISRPPRRFDAKAFTQAFPPETFPSMYKTTTKVEPDRDQLAPAVVEKYSVSGDPRVVVK